MPNGTSDADSPSSTTSTPKSGTSIRVKAQAKVQTPENVRGKTICYYLSTSPCEIQMLPMVVMMHSVEILTNLTMLTILSNQL